MYSSISARTNIYLVFESGTEVSTMASNTETDLVDSDANTSLSETIRLDWFVSLLSYQPSVVDLSNNDIYGELSMISAAPNGLNSLELSNNRFLGKFPTFSITSLKVLVLSNNNFSGELSEMGDLDVMNNSFLVLYLLLWVL